MNPYSDPAPQRPADIRPLYKRKRVWAVGVALVLFGVVGGSQSAQDETAKAHALAAKPAATVTATVTATETAKPAPAPTVTKTKTVETPGPTVTVTRPAGSAGSADGASAGGVAAGGGSNSGSTGAGGNTGGGGVAAQCSIVSNAGNCYQAGQFCRNSDRGAQTTTASGTRITCSNSGNAWRWTAS